MSRVFSRWRVVLIAFGIGGLIANSVVLYVTFLFAYFSNRFVFSININTYGEACLEFVVIPLSLVVGVYSVVVLFKQVNLGGMLFR